MSIFYLNQRDIRKKTMLLLGHLAYHAALFKFKAKSILDTVDLNKCANKFGGVDNIIKNKKILLADETT